MEHESERRTLQRNAAVSNISDSLPDSVSAVYLAMHALAEDRFYRPGRGTDTTKERWRVASFRRTPSAYLISLVPESPVSGSDSLAGGGSVEVGPGERTRVAIRYH